MVENGTLMQYFEWNLPADGKLWKNLAQDAAKLMQNGVTGVWLPPACKGAEGASDSGFNVYDLYDLGEFRQKGSVRTKYGTKKDYLAAIDELHDKKINVYADVVLDHKSGADGVESVSASEFNEKHTYQMIGEDKVIGACTKFAFPGRKGKYSDFVWNWTHFGGIDWDQKKVKQTISQLTGKETDAEDGKGSFDYLMGSDIDLSNREVYEEFVRWAVWYVNTAGIDGFCLDAAKHVPGSFYREFLNEVRRVTGKELFSVGEYWNGDVNVLSEYLASANAETSVLDVALHYRFYDASRAKGAYDLRRIFDGTLVDRDPVHAVTFVDNHNTQPGQPAESWVEEWFKPLAYALILLRKDGYPCVFYGDYKGIANDRYKGEKALLDKLMKLRKQKAYGPQHDYFDDPDCIGWTREGDEDHKDSGMAVVLSDGKGGTKRMYIGRQFAGAHFSDIMGNAKYNIKIDNEGCGEFYVNRGAVAVWVRKEPK